MTHDYLGNNKFNLRDYSLKFRYSEKATEVEKNLPILIDVRLKFKKKLRDFLKFIWPFQNT